MSYRAIDVVDVTKSFYSQKKPSIAFFEHLFGLNLNNKNTFNIINNISFSLDKGETVGIIGENGAGKSTLLKLISGIHEPSSGHISVNGKVIALLELGAGFNPEYTGIENIYINANLLGYSNEQVDVVLNDIIDFSELGSKVSEQVKTYSSGMYVRLAFSIAVAFRPEVLIIDEALAVGDIRFQAKCFERIKSLKASGTTILFVSHDIGSVRQLCDKAIWIENGSIKLIGSVNNVTSKYVEFMNRDGVPEENFNTEVSAIEVDDIAPITIEGIDTSLPINHWGTEKGLIKSCFVLDEDLRVRNVFKNGEPIIVQMEFELPKHFVKNGFGAAISIRNTNGLDLVVFDTIGDGVTFGSEAGAINCQFYIPNTLNEGNYVLAAVLEDRSGATPAYLEFIEGVRYFSVIRNRTYFGICIPGVECTINYVGSNK